MRVFIDGTIASGKSTQLKMLNDRGYDVYPEKIDTWPLDEFYRDPRRWALPLQIAVLKSYAGTINTDHVAIFERSPESARQVFWRNLCDNNVVSEDDKDVYTTNHTLYAWQPDLFIKLVRSPDACFNSLKTRGQVGDEMVSMDYLKDLDRLYSRLEMDCPSLVINVDNKTPEQICDQIVAWMHAHTHDASAKSS